MGKFHGGKNRPNTENIDGRLLRRGTTNEDSILKLYKSHSAQHRGGILYGGTRVRKLRRNFHSALATRRYGPLPVQRVRSLPQDERNESTLGEAATAIGKEEMEGDTTVG